MGYRGYGVGCRLQGVGTWNFAKSKVDLPSGGYVSWLLTTYTWKKICFASGIYRGTSLIRNTHPPKINKGLQAYGYCRVLRGVVSCERGTPVRGLFLLSEVPLCFTDATRIVCTTKEDVIYVISSCSPRTRGRRSAPV